MNSLVSIVSPCYNGEKYIGRYLDAIISQTYRPLELILVNDGSKDKTDEIISSYKEKLENDDIIFKYIKKENAGTGEAVNDGLKLATGDFLIWPDTDDVLLPNSIEERVKFLENNKEFAFVYSDGEAYFESNLDNPIKKIQAIIPNDGYLFENVISGNVVFNPCGYMLRMSAFVDVNPSKSIYPSRYGQNIQMLMPISYKYKCGHLKKVLYKRIDRENSLSKRVWNESDMAWKNRELGLSDIYTQTLLSMDDEMLVYVPYIKYRNLRALTGISKKINKETYKKFRRILFKSTCKLIKEELKTIINLITHRF